MRVQAPTICVLILATQMGCGDNVPVLPIDAPVQCEPCTRCTTTCCLCESPLRGCRFRRCDPNFFAGEYSIEVVRGFAFPSVRGDGSAWDPDGLPDPYVAVSHHGNLLGATHAIQDSLEPIWQEPVASNVALDPGDVLRLAIVDEDGEGDEIIFSCDQRVDDEWSLLDETRTYIYNCNKGSPDYSTVQITVTGPAEL